MQTKPVSHTDSNIFNRTSFLLMCQDAQSGLSAFLTLKNGRLKIRSTIPSSEKWHDYKFYMLSCFCGNAEMQGKEKKAMRRCNQSTRSKAMLWATFWLVDVCRAQAISRTIFVRDLESELRNAAVGSWESELRKPLLPLSPLASLPARALSALPPPILNHGIARRSVAKL